MHVTLWSCSTHNCERERNDKHEKTNLDQRGDIFEPGEKYVRHDEDGAGDYHKDRDYSRYQ